ncbi:MAG: hypothetical protein OEZ20_00160 [candidate division WOR-3 bacterium]|nr:hypothetical protein [candidate division WOR-3 bacterium]
MNTELMITRLRCEIGEVITTWKLMRHFASEKSQLVTGNFARDSRNSALWANVLLENKLRNELVSRLSELANKKLGSVNFYSVAYKLNAFQLEVEAFARFIDRSRIKRKRDREVSHKELPESWKDFLHEVEIPYGTLLRATASAVRLVKKIDRRFLGPAAPYLWHELRKKRYEIELTPSLGYLLLPHLRLSPEARLRILKEELKDGTESWTTMRTKLDGRDVTVQVNKKWGIIRIGRRLVVVNNYPLQSLKSIKNVKGTGLDEIKVNDYKVSP